MLTKNSVYRFHLCTDLSLQRCNLKNISSLYVLAREYFVHSITSKEQLPYVFLLFFIFQEIVLNRVFNLKKNYAKSLASIVNVSSNLNQYSAVLSRSQNAFWRQTLSVTSIIYDDKWCYPTSETGKGY